MDIGYHYVAVDANGKPIDTDGDGLPDYAEDTNGNGSLDPGETAWTNADTDGDGLSDYEEVHTYHTDPTKQDTDGDGLTDYEELHIPIDVNHPGPDHLDPLVADTGGTGTPDGQKDADHDGLSNLGELRKYHSNPANANSFPFQQDDAPYFFMAPVVAYGPANTRTYIGLPQFFGSRIRLTLFNALPNAKWDIYYKPNLSVPKMRLFCAGAPGQTVFEFTDPDSNHVSGFWTAFAGEDDDGDGLSNGYEMWFLHSNGRTVVDDPDTDGDKIRDGWEVAYGLDPTDRTGENGAAGNPDGDAYPNYALPDSGEYNKNGFFEAASYDPLKPYGSTTPGQTARPIVSLSSSSSQAEAPGGTATFTIHRSIGLGADLTQPLTVYYSLGGSAIYDSDYSLSPAPTEFPRICSAVIDVGQTAVTVTLAPLLAGVKQAGLQMVVVNLVPFEVATNPETTDADAWLYVVDLFHQAVTLNICNGILINLEKTTPDGYLRIKSTSDTSPLPFINVANTARGTVARVYTGTNLTSDPSRIVSEYFSAPGSMDREPSRTTVDRYGNVWVGNRAQAGGDGGSIAEYGVVIGGTRGKIVDGAFREDPNPLPTGEVPGEYLKPPFIYNTCVDRHGTAVTDPPDGLIHTSRGSNLQLPWSNSGNADSLGGVSTADDEAILRYIRVKPTGVRTIIVDPNNNLWVGSKDDVSWNEFIDTRTGMQVTGRRLSFQGGGYGGVIDGYGAVWSSGHNEVESGSLLRFLPGTAMPVIAGGTIRGTGANYGVTVDPNSGDVWQPLYSSPNVMQFRADHCATTFPIGQTQNRGIVIDGHGSVWVGGSDSTIFHLTTSGAQVGTVLMSFTPPGQQNSTTARQPLGVAVDSSGLIWAICWNGGDHGYAMRVDPARGVIPEGGDRPVGEVVEVVDLGEGSGPYNYSDMSGFVALSVTQPAGVWDHVEDAGTADTLWTSVTIAANIYANTKIVVEVRGANSITDLPSWPFVTVVTAGETLSQTISIPPGIKGRYLEVRANLVRNFGVAQTPELRTLTVQHGAAGCAIEISTHPRSRAVAPGASVTDAFTVVAQVPQGATATYQWRKDGSDIDGARTSALSLNNIQYTAAGRYSVRVGTESGCTYQLESAPARLHVTGNPPELTQDFGVPVPVPIGGTATLTAEASVGSNLGETPLYYQWRFNNEPIGATETCNGNPCIVTRDVAGQCANAGNYSVVFWNQYGQVSTHNYELSISGQSPVTVTPSETTVTSADQIVKLTANTCLGSVNCVQWYLTIGGQKIPVTNPNPSDPPNPLEYTLARPITCDKLGTYTVSVADGSWNAYEASAAVNPGSTGAGASIASTTLHVVPDAIGGDPWVYQWYSSADLVDFSLIYGATSSSLTPTAAGYYKLTARRSGGIAIIIAHYEPGGDPPKVTAQATLNATLDVTYAAQATGTAWTYQWYFIPSDTVFEQLIPGASSYQYQVQTVGCARKGTYRVYPNCIDGSASASLDVQKDHSISFTTLHITPDNAWGTGTWGYQWYVSESVTGPWILIAGETDRSLALFVNYVAANRHYKCIASRSGFEASIVALTFFGNGRYDSSKVTLENKSHANLDVTYAAGVGAGPWAFQWYFTPLGGAEQLISSATASQYTVQSVGCAQRGAYRVEAVDGCGGYFKFDNGSKAELDDVVDNCP